MAMERQAPPARGIETKGIKSKFEGKGLEVLGRSELNGFLGTTLNEVVDELKKQRRSDYNFPDRKDFNYLFDLSREHPSKIPAKLRKGGVFYYFLNCVVEDYEDKKSIGVARYDEKEKRLFFSSRPLNTVELNSEDRFIVFKK